MSYDNRCLIAMILLYPYFKQAFANVSCLQFFRVPSHCGRPSQEAMGLSGETCVESSTKWAENS